MPTRMYYVIVHRPSCSPLIELRGQYSSTRRVYCIRNVVAHGDAREGKWRGNWRMEWVASNLTRPRNVVYPALLTLMRTPRLPAVDWTGSPADLNGPVRLGERRNLVSERVPSGSARALLPYYCLSLFFSRSGEIQWPACHGLVNRQVQ